MTFAKVWNWTVLFVWVATITGWSHTTYNWVVNRVPPEDIVITMLCALALAQSVVWLLERVDKIITDSKKV